MNYFYGMKHRGFSPACQPMKGLVQRIDDPTGRYFDILEYRRELTDAEIRNYELEKVNPEAEEAAARIKPEK